MEGARPAVATDLGVIEALVAELRDELIPMRGGLIWSLREARENSDRAAFNELLGEEASQIYVGTIDDTVIAVGTATVVALHDGSKLGVINELFVTPGARAIGVGECLLEALVEWCTAQKCIGIDALALPGHRATKNFFEGAGFTARSITMHTAL